MSSISGDKTSSQILTSPWPLIPETNATLNKVAKIGISLLLGICVSVVAYFAISLSLPASIGLGIGLGAIALLALSYCHSKAGETDSPDDDIDTRYLVEHDHEEDVKSHVEEGAIKTTSHSSTN